MLESEKELWKDVLEAYREMSFLWDPKDDNYQNKKMRFEAYEMMMQIYLKIDPNGTLRVFKKRLENMRTAFNRERKKAKLSNESGGPPYVPTLWYYDLLSFLEEIPNTSISDMNETQESYSFNFNKAKNKIYLEKRVSNGLKRKRERSFSSCRDDSAQGFISISPNSPIEYSEEDTSQTSQPSQSKRRIHNLLEKQEKFMDVATKILTKKEKDWEVIGKAIGLQLSGLEGNQRTIAQKLISDTIFYGNIGRLNLDSFIHVDTLDQESPSDIEVNTFDDL